MICFLFFPSFLPTLLSFSFVVATLYLEGGGGRGAGVSWGSFLFFFFFKVFFFLVVYVCTFSFTSHGLLDVGWTGDAGIYLCHGGVLRCDNNIASLIQPYLPLHGLWFEQGDQCTYVAAPSTCATRNTCRYILHIESSRVWILAAGFIRVASGGEGSAGDFRGEAGMERGAKKGGGEKGHMFFARQLVGKIWRGCGRRSGAGS